MANNAKVISRFRDRGNPDRKRDTNHHPGYVEGKLLWDELFGDDDTDKIGSSIERLKRFKHSLLMASMLGNCMIPKASEGPLERIKNFKNCSAGLHKLTSEKISCVLDILQHDIGKGPPNGITCQYCDKENEAMVYLAKYS